MQCSCFSTTVFPMKANKSADAFYIEKQMKLAAKAEEKTIHVLLLGPGSSGKTTTLKQIKKIHSFDDKEEEEARKKLTLPIKQAVAEYMKILCTESVKLNDKYSQNTLVDPNNEHLRSHILSLSSPCLLTQDIAAEIKMLFADEGIKTTLKLRQYYQIDENADYFFESVDRICSQAYVPSFDDYVRFRQRSVGFSQTKIPIEVGKSGVHHFDFTDVAGQRSERRKWMKFIADDMHAVIFILAISDYDLKMVEDNKTNRLQDSIDLFRTIMNRGDFWQNKSIILFFNKYDLFQEKIKSIPITVAFDDFPTDEMNPNDDDDVVRFVARKFMDVVTESNVHLEGSLHVMRTTALDTGNVQKVFASITMDLVTRRLKFLKDTNLL